MTRSSVKALIICVAVAAGGLLTGCAGVNNPYATTAPQATPTTSTSTASASSGPLPHAGDPASERGGTIPRRAAAAQQWLTAGAGAAEPQVAIGRYMQLYVNWTAADVADRQRELATISVGQARAQALQAAVSAARDPLLARSQVTNSGQVISIAPGQGPAAGEWVIVTSERSSGQGSYNGLPPELHITYAAVTHTTHGWVISQWKPQN